MFFEFDNVAFSYDKIKALNSLSFGGDRGQVVGLIGDNGAGKSTALKIVVRYLTPDSGCVRLDGKDIAGIRLGSYPVSYVPDTPVFYEELSLLEHLQFTKAVYPDNGTDIDSILDRMELHEHLGKVPSALSKGTRQKLMLAMALLREYELLVLDEPFSGLDPGQIALLKKTILQQRDSGKCIILSSHLLDVVENLCDKYVIIKRGELVADGTREELIQKTGLSPDSTMERIYLRLVSKDE